MNRRVCARFTFAALAMVLAACLALPSRACAQELELGNLILDNQAGNITVRFGVRLDEMALLEEELSAGSVLALVCNARVHKKYFLVDSSVAETPWLSILKKDVLAEEYVLELPGAEKPMRSKDLSQLLEKAWGRLVLDLGPWTALEQGNEYRLNLELSIARSDVPTWLRYMLFFRSWNVYDPVSYQLDFSY